MVVASVGPLQQATLPHGLHAKGIWPFLKAPHIPGQSMGFSLLTLPS